MDVIASTAFGIRVDSQRDKNNMFVTKAKKSFTMTASNPVLIIICELLRLAYIIIMVYSS